MKKNQVGFNKIKPIYRIIFLTGLLGLQMSADPVTLALEVMQSVVGTGGVVPTSLTLSTLGSLNYTVLKRALTASGLPVTEITGQGTLTNTDNFGFSFGANLGFAFPATTWPHAAVPNLYTLLSAVPSFTLSTGITYLMLAFDGSGNLIIDLTKATPTALNFYLFAYDAQGTSLFPAGISVPIATMGNVWTPPLTMTSNLVEVNLNYPAVLTPSSGNYPTSLIVTSATQAAALAKASRGIPAKSSLTKPVPQSSVIALQPTVDPKTLPGVTHVVAIPSTVTAIQVWPATNVGDLYTEFSFSAANLALINAALAKGTSLQFALNIQQNNANYNVTATVYDLQNNVIATEVRNNVVNKAGAGVSNTANIAVGSPITAPAVFTYYNLGIQRAGQTDPVTGQPYQVSMNGMTLNSTVILAASAKSVAITSPIQKLEIISGSSVPWLYIDILVSARNILDMNTALASGQALTMSVNVVANPDGNYDFMFAAYDATGNIVAQEARASVVNSSIAKNTANIAFNEVIPVAAGTFSGANLTCTLMNTQEALTLENVPFTNSITLAPTIPASSMVELPAGITSLTDINVMAQFGTQAAPAVVFDPTDFSAINTAIAAGHTVSVQCDIENGELLLGAYDFTASDLLAVENFELPKGVTAAQFSGYELQYLVAGQAAGTTVPAAQTFQCAAGQTVTFVPATPIISVSSSIVPGVNGATAFTANTASLAPIAAMTELAYNQATPASVVGGLPALQLISAQFTDANMTAFLKFDFTPTAGLQNITQELLDNGLYVCLDIVENYPAQGQYSAVAYLTDAQSHIYAQGTAVINTQMVYGWVGFNMENVSTAPTATTTYVKMVPLAAQQPVLYRQQTVTSPVQ